jgi:hypothetical protein
MSPEAQNDIKMNFYDFYIITTLYWGLRSCSGAQFSSFSIGVTLVVCLKSLYTNRADRLCTASSII